MPNIRISGAVGEALQGVGASITGAAEKAKAQQDRQEDFKAQQGWLLMQAKLEGEYNTYKENSNDEGSDAYPNFKQKAFAPITQDFLKGLSPRKREEFEARLPVLEQGYANDGETFTRQKTDANNTNMLSDYQLTVKADLARNPDNFHQALRAGNELIANSGKSQSVRNILREKMLNEFLSSAVDGYIAQGRFDEARELVQRANNTSAERTSYTTAPVTTKGTLNPNNWPLRFYKPEDLTGPRSDEQFIQAKTGYAADELGRRFFNKTGIRVEVNLPPGPGRAGHRRGTTSPVGSPHVEHSQHHLGAAIDFQIQGLTDNQKAEFLREGLRMGFTGVGFYEGGPGHLHLDMGRPRTWGRMPKWAQSIMANKPAPIQFGNAIPDGSQPAPVRVAQAGGNTVSDASPSGPDVSDLRATSVDPSTWDKRPDGSTKGNGWLGVLKTPKGLDVSEFSISMDGVIGGKDFPSLVPTLTREEVKQVLAKADDPKGQPPLSQSIKQKAAAWAKKQVAQGKSPFAGDDTASDTADETPPGQLADDASANAMITPGTKYSALSKRIDAEEVLWNKQDTESIKIERRKAEDDLTSRWLDGKLTGKDVEGYADVLTPATRQKYHRMADKIDAQETETNTLKEFSDRVETVTEQNIGQFEEDLQDAYVDGKIKRFDTTRFMRMAKRRIGADPSYDSSLIANYRDRVRVSLAPDEDNDKPALLNRLAAMEQFDNMVHEHRKANKPVTAEVLKRFADDVVKQYSTQNQQDGRAKLEMSPYLNGKGRYAVSKEDIVAGLKKLKEDQQKGLAAAEYEKQFNIIKQWASQLLIEEEKKGNK
jgi:hypothetical protein